VPDRSITDANVLVLGIGILGGGQGVARYLRDAGANVRASDMRAEADFDPALVAELRAQGCELHFGGHPIEDVEWADIVFRNPAVRQEAPILVHAREAGKRIEMEIKFFAERCPAPVIIVTGSKGKTTTTMLLRQLLDAGSRRHVAMAGNMGVSALAMLDSLTPDDIALLEVSSFLLEEAPDGGWHPHVAVITNVGDDHLDRYHHSIDEYRAVKVSVTAGQTAGDWMVLPAWDDAILAATASTAAHRVLVHDVRGDRGPARASHELFVAGGRFVATGFAVEAMDLGRIDDLALHGAHNATNFLFAAGAALASGVGPAAIRATMPGLAAVSHRLEGIGTHRGLTFVDDTTATAPMAVVAALDALPAGSAVVICGGHDKGATFDPMVAALATRAAAVVLLGGTGTDRFIDELRTQMPPQRLSTAGSMAEAVQAAVELASIVNANTVLLSPGCASFGGFRNEFDRADQFRAAVREFSSP
jgi:UDP-N-acetylmuramoylalanine--D-glutamate ligase